MAELGKRSIDNFFEHRMPTYAEQLSYRGLFGLFPFIILVFTLLAVLQLDAVFDRLIEAAKAQPQQIPEPLEPVAEEGRAQTQFLGPLIEQAREQAGEDCLLRYRHIVVVGLRGSIHLTEALNAACGVQRRARGGSGSSFALVFGPFLALAFIVACGLMLIGPHGGVARWAGGPGRGVGGAWCVAALPGSTLPAHGGALGRLPVRPRHRSVVLVCDARRSLRRDRVAIALRILALPGQLRGSRPDLRQPRDGQGC